MKKIILVLTVILLLTVLVGCERTHYRVTVIDERDLLYENPPKWCEAGKSIIIKTHILTDVDVICYVNNESIGKQNAVEKDGKFSHWEYNFVMPARDVTVTFEMSGKKEYLASDE